MSPRAQTALWIALAAFVFYAITGGGRIVGSDEVTMLELSRAMLHGHLDVPEGATLKGPDGHFYTKNMPAQAVLALPLVAIAETATRAAGLPAEKQMLALRFFVSFFNAIVTAVLLAAFYAFARELGIGVGAALATTGMLGLTTPLWVYAKSFMAEPLEALGLLLTLWGSYRAADRRGWPWLASFGFLLATLSKLSVSLLALFCLGPLIHKENWKRGLLVGVALPICALVLAGLYNWARFHNPLETGYGAQASGSAFTTPLLVGLYGLLFSSGKGLFWFAPGVWLYRDGNQRMTELMRAGQMPYRRNLASVALSVLFAFLAAVIVIYGRFEHWAGDGSFGPRYLLPIVPLLFLAVAFAIQFGGRDHRWLARLLALAGLIVQIGGVAIHFGAEMREVGDYPYMRPLNDPHFMSESHFDPHQSPIAIHWQMLLRNAGEHLRGHAPRLEAAGTPDARIGVSASDQERLLHGLDFWWLYMGYVGFVAWPIGIALALLLALLAWAATRLGRAARHEARAG